MEKNKITLILPDDTEKEIETTEELDEKVIRNFFGTPLHLWPHPTPPLYSA
tara:strand:+ start:2388 stop:2540 length:153 start_codon:yes stop_codon:yes gene_type:complete